jgi:hypothetical protein
MIKIYGASDDLVEVEGDINEEFGWFADNDKPRPMGFSDGTLLSVRYDEDGIWRITLIESGTAVFNKKEGSVSQDTNDEVTLTGNIRWVVLGNEFAAIWK